MADDAGGRVYWMARPVDAGKVDGAWVVAEVRETPPMDREAAKRHAARMREGAKRAAWVAAARRTE